MYGHASDREREAIYEFEERASATGSVADLLKLAQVYVEPAHEEQLAIPLLEQILDREPSNAVAKLWLAYCGIHFLMDEASLRRAVRLLESIIDSRSQLDGAARMLLAEVLEDLGELTPTRKTELLEASVRLQPDWVFNRVRLGRAYRAQGRLAEGKEHFQVALSNLTTESSEWDLAARAFESSITGRLADRKQLEQEAKQTTEAE
jgi:tetratricopeptide (TPR) repeat protein